MGDNLRLRGFDFVDWCIMCCCCGETVDYLLLHCGKAYRLWCFVFRSFGISWFPSRMVLDLLFSWWNWLGKNASYIWNLVPLCLMWCIWRERNRRTPEDLDRSEDQMLALFSGSLFDWARLGDSHLVTLFLFSLALFLCNLCFLCFWFADVPSLLYFCFADAYLHLAVFLNILSLTYQKKKKTICYPI